LFGGSVQIVTSSTYRPYDPSAITMSQIAFVVFAVMIFVGSLIALIVAQYSWTRWVPEHRYLCFKVYLLNLFYMSALSFGKSIAAKLSIAVNVHTCI